MLLSGIALLDDQEQQSYHNQHNGLMVTCIISGGSLGNDQTGLALDGVEEGSAHLTDDDLYWS